MLFRSRSSSSARHETRAVASNRAVRLVLVLVLRELLPSAVVGVGMGVSKHVVVLVVLREPACATAGGLLGAVLAHAEEEGDERCDSCDGADDANDGRGVGGGARAGGGGESGVGRGGGGGGLWGGAASAMEGGREEGTRTLEVVTEADVLPRTEVLVTAGEAKVSAWFKKRELAPAVGLRGPGPKRGAQGTNHPPTNRPSDDTVACISVPAHSNSTHRTDNVV